MIIFYLIQKYLKKYNINFAYNLNSYITVANSIILFLCIIYKIIKNLTNKSHNTRHIFVKHLYLWYGSSYHILNCFYNVLRLLVQIMLLLPLLLYDVILYTPGFPFIVKNQLTIFYRIYLQNKRGFNLHCKTLRQKLIIFSVTPAATNRRLFS